MPYGKLVNGVDVCKFGKQWVVSAAAMKRAYGEAKGSAVSRTHWPFFDHQLTTGSNFCYRWLIFIVGTLFYITCDRCVLAVQNQQKITVYHRIVLRVVVLRPGRPEVRILPVAPENLIAMRFLQWGFLFLLVFDFQNNFSSISSAASVYCPFPRRSFLSLFIVIRMRRISSVEKVVFYRLGENWFSVSVAPGFPCYSQVPFLDSNSVPVLSVRYFCLLVSAWFFSS